MGFLYKNGVFALLLSSSLFLASCGAETQVSDLEVVGGKLASRTGFFQKSVVSLLSSTGRSFCSGTIISKEHVLTAAHCVNKIKVAYIGFGTDFSKRSNIKRSQLREATTQFGHEDFNSPKAAFRGLRDYLKLEKPINDIALVKFTGGLPEGAKVVKLAPDNESIGRGDQIIYAGFGLTGKKKSDSGILRYIDSKIYLQVQDTSEIITSDLIGRTICSGDSGGPMFIIERGDNGKVSQIQQVGVASRANCISRAFHTDTTKFLDWIDLAKEKIEVLEKAKELSFDFSELNPFHGR